MLYYVTIIVSSKKNLFKVLITFLAVGDCKEEAKKRALKFFNNYEFQKYFDENEPINIEIDSIEEKEDYPYAEVSLIKIL